MVNYRGHLFQKENMFVSSEEAKQIISAQLASLNEKLKAVPQELDYFRNWLSQKEGQTFCQSFVQAMRSINELLGKTEVAPDAKSIEAWSQLLHDLSKLRVIGMAIDDGKEAGLGFFRRFWHQVFGRKKEKDPLVWKKFDLFCRHLIAARKNWITHLLQEEGFFEQDKSSHLAERIHRLGKMAIHSGAICPHGIKGGHIQGANLEYFAVHADPESHEPVLERGKIIIAPDGYLVEKTGKVFEDFHLLLQSIGVTSSIKNQERSLVQKTASALMQEAKSVDRNEIGRFFEKLKNARTLLQESLLRLAYVLNQKGANQFELFIENENPPPLFTATPCVIEGPKLVRGGDSLFESFEALKGHFNLGESLFSILNRAQIIGQGMAMNHFREFAKIIEEEGAPKNEEQVAEQFLLLKQKKAHHHCFTILEKMSLHSFLLYVAGHTPMTLTVDVERGFIELVGDTEPRLFLNFEAIKKELGLIETAAHKLKKISREKLESFDFFLRGVNSIEGLVTMCQAIIASQAKQTSHYLLWREKRSGVYFLSILSGKNLKNYPLDETSKPGFLQINFEDTHIESILMDHFEEWLQKESVATPLKKAEVYSLLKQKEKRQVLEKPALPYVRIRKRFSSNFFQNPVSKRHAKEQLQNQIALFASHADGSFEFFQETKDGPLHLIVAKDGKILSFSITVDPEGNFILEDEQKKKKWLLKSPDEIFGCIAILPNPIVKKELHPLLMEKQKLLEMGSYYDFEEAGRQINEFENYAHFFAEQGKMGLSAHGGFIIYPDSQKMGCLMVEVIAGPSLTRRFQIDLAKKPGFFAVLEIDENGLMHEFGVYKTFQELQQKLGLKFRLSELQKLHALLGGEALFEHEWIQVCSSQEEALVLLRKSLLPVEALVDGVWAIRPMHPSDAHLINDLLVISTLAESEQAAALKIVERLMRKHHSKRAPDHFFIQALMHGKTGLLMKEYSARAVIDEKRVVLEYKGKEHDLKSLLKAIQREEKREEELWCPIKTLAKLDEQKKAFIEAELHKIQTSECFLHSEDRLLGHLKRQQKPVWGLSQISEADKNTLYIKEPPKETLCDAYLLTVAYSDKKVAHFRLDVHMALQLEKGKLKGSPFYVLTDQKGKSESFQNYEELLKAVNALCS